MKIGQLKKKGSSIIMAIFIFSAIIGQVSAENGMTSEKGSGIEANSLSFFNSQSIQGDYVAAGVGLRESPSGTITISEIPEGSSITKAYLYWGILGTTEDSDFKTGVFDSTPITGTMIGTNSDPCWLDPAGYTWNYRAEVTSIVTGNGDYSVSGFSTIGLREGVSLVIIYTNPSSLNHDIVIYDGADTIDSYVSSVGTLMSGFTANGVSARTTYIVADGQTTYTDNAYFNGNLIETNPFSGLDGNFWDTRTYDVSSSVPLGATSASMTISKGAEDGDCLVHTVQVLSVTTNEVTNTPPIAEAGGPYTVTVGNYVQLDGSGSSDPDGDALTYLWDLNNDGTYETNSVKPMLTASFPATLIVGLQVSDGKGGTSTDTATVIVTASNVAPVVEAGPDATIDEGDAFSGSGSFTDPDIDSWTATVDYGDGTGVQPLALSGKTFTLGHTYTDNCACIVTVTVTDDDGGIGTDTATVTVNNVAPVVDAGSNATINEGSTFSSSGSFTDDGNNTWTATVDYGDGTGVQTLALSGKTFTLGHTYADNCACIVTVTVTDDDGGIGTDTAIVTVNNVAPVVDAGSNATINEGSTFSSSGSFTDAGNDTWTATVDYGDGSGIQPLALSGKTFTLGHTYADNCACTVTVTVTDDDGGIGTDTATVTVNNVTPAVKINISYYVDVPMELIIAGQGKIGNSVELQIIQDGAVVASKKIIRKTSCTSKDKDDKAAMKSDKGDDSKDTEYKCIESANLTAKIDPSKPYTGKLIFDTTEAISGGTPVWIKADGKKEKITTFNTQKGKTSSYHQVYNFELDDLFTLTNKEITFTGKATDPGTDDLTFNWNFSDGTIVSKFFPWNNSHSVTDTVKHIYSAAGSFNVTLKVTDDDGGIGSDTITINSLKCGDDDEEDHDEHDGSDDEHHEDDKK